MFRFTIRELLAVMVFFALFAWSVGLICRCANAPLGSALAVAAITEMGVYAVMGAVFGRDKGTWGGMALAVAVGFLTLAAAYGAVSD